MPNVILDATRTAIGSFGGALKDIPAPELGAHVIRTLIERNGVEGSQVDNVIMGVVVPAGMGQIPSRQATIKAGLPVETPSETINKVCASGLRAIALADMQLRAGEGQLIVAGGMENMSRIPYADVDRRWGAKMGNSTELDLMIHDGLWCAFDNVHMASHGEKVAREYGLDRAACDAFACRSQSLAGAAMDAGRLAEEITPFSIPQRKGDPIVFERDEQPRADTTEEKLAGLRPVLGTELITAGNAPSVNDGAGAALVCTEEMAGRLGRKPLAYILGEAHVAMQPYQFPIAPAFAVKKLLQKAGRKLEDIALIECNEAFAAVALAVGKELGWDENRVNPNGGAVAFGHPIGASGARIVMTLAYELRRRGGGLGIAAICSGSGQGDAILIEVPAA
jgi:acetyl-CoA C-acetyltransferase